MRIADIVRDCKGIAGHNGAWEVAELNADHDVSPYEKWSVYRLTHHGHHMLTWAVSKNGVTILYVSTGHGSVSDQGGMNQAFKVLGVPWYFSRRGGACIIDMDWVRPDSASPSGIVSTETPINYGA